MPRRWPTPVTSAKCLTPIIFRHPEGGHRPSVMPKRLPVRKLTRVLTAGTAPLGRWLATMTGPDRMFRHCPPYRGTRRMRSRPMLVGVSLALLASAWLAAAAQASPPTGDYIVVLNDGAK